MLPVTVRGLGYYLPQNKVSSETLDKQLKLPLGTVAKKSVFLIDILLLNTKPPLI